MRWLVIAFLLVQMTNESYGQAFVVIKGIMKEIPGKSGGELMGKTGNPATFEGFYFLDTLGQKLISTTIKRYEDAETSDNVDLDQFTLHLNDLEISEVPEHPIFDDETLKTPFFYIDFLCKDLEASVEHYACLHEQGTDQLILAESPVWIRFYFLDEVEANTFLATTRTFLNTNNK